MAGTSHVLLFLVLATLSASVSGTRFLSFDASLLLGVDTYSLERLQNINYELAILSLTGLSEHVDAMCLQGYYLPYQLFELYSILGPYLPYYYSATPKTGTCFCNTTEASSLSPCLSTCATLSSSSAQLLCGFKCLSMALSSLSLPCQGCITGQLSNLVSGAVNITTAINQCVAPYIADPSIDGSSCVPYGGYSGNVLFSRSELRNTSTKSLAYSGASGLLNSDAIFAVSSFSGLGDVNLVCTQLQPAGPLTASQVVLLDNINEGYQTPMLQDLITMAVGQSTTERVVVMGNFKQSPNISAAGINPINSNGYGSWLEAGYQDPFMRLQKCTYCPTNAYVATGYLNYLSGTTTSHVFLKGFDNGTKEYSVSSSITLNTATTILDLTVATTPQAVSVPYSPSYGVIVDVTTVSSTSAAAATMSWLTALLSA